MKQVLTTTGKGTLTGLLHFRVIIPGLEFLNRCTHTGLIYGQRVLTSRFSANGKRFILPACFFIFGLTHDSSYGANPERSTASALVNHRVRTSPYSVQRADFRCPDLTAMMVPPQADFGEAYVRCEDWDLFQQAMRAGDRTGAEALTFAPKGGR